MNITNCIPSEANDELDNTAQQKSQQYSSNSGGKTGDYFGRPYSKRELIDMPLINKLNRSYDDYNARFGVVSSDFLPSKPVPEETVEEGIIDALEMSRIESLNWFPTFIARKDFESIKWPYAEMNDMNMKLLKLPEILANEARLATDPDLQMAYSFLEGDFYRWMSVNKDSTLPEEQYVTFVPLKWATDTDLARHAIADLIPNLLNDAAKEEFRKRLEDTENGQKESLKTRLLKMAQNANGEEYVSIPFDDTDLPPHLWHKKAYQSRPVQHTNFTPLFVDKINKRANAQFRTLGDYNISALAKGEYRLTKDGEYKVCVDEVYLFINDHFNFDGSGWLSFWDFKNMRYGGDFGLLNTLLENEDFQDFRKRTGYGKDFRVVSLLHKYADFKPQCWTVK